ncbi:MULTISPECIES: XRE family transcriptional regulator [Kitasatospora]|uniref:XRE family transcriptional regulator n=1 Tax=Kitasatospora TaxID=2063 RepID=UPI0036B3FE4D
MGEDALVGTGTLAQRLDYLIRTLHPEGRGPYGYIELADLIKKNAAADDGPTVSHGTIQSIRSGKVTNPGVDSLRALASFFGVPTGYFTDDEVAEVVVARIEEIRDGADKAAAGDELATVLEDQQVRALTLRLGGLSKKALKAITSVVDGVRAGEGLPAVPEANARKRRKD